MNKFLSMISLLMLFSLNANAASSLEVKVIKDTQKRFDSMLIRKLAYERAVSEFMTSIDRNERLLRETRVIQADNLIEESDKLKDHYK